MLLNGIVPFQAKCNITSKNVISFTLHHRKAGFRLHMNEGKVNDNSVLLNAIIA